MPSMGFEVADGWPFIGEGEEAQKRAVRAVSSLVANHTLIVGQSRSGKTNAARIVIEQILMWTDARLIILDPNADFKELQHAAEEGFAKTWEPIAKKIEVAARDSTAWGIKWSELSLAEMAAFLRIAPKDDFAVYRHLLRHREFEKKSSREITSLESFIDSQYFQAASGEELERYQVLLQQLNELNVWAAAKGTDLDSILSAESSVVIDLSADDEQVRSITAARALEVLWRDGEKRRREFVTGRKKEWSGTLVVIDEAHMFAPPEAADDDPRKRLVRERIRRFADQGKKLNLHLMLITQQPGKLHGDVLSECNNRIVLRMSERRSLEVLERTFGGLRGRYDGALTFEPSSGEALIEGDRRDAGERLVVPNQLVSANHSAGRIIRNAVNSFS